MEVKTSILKFHPDDIERAKLLTSSLRNATIVYADRVEVILPQSATWDTLRRTLHAISVFITREVHIVIVVIDGGKRVSLPLTLIPGGWPVEARTGKAA